MLVLKGVVFLNDFIWRLIVAIIAVIGTWTIRMAFKNVHPSIYRRAIVICKRVLVQGAYYCSRNLALSPSYSLADVGLGEGIVAIDRTPAFSTAV